VNIRIALSITAQSGGVTVPSTISFVVADRSRNSTRPVESRQLSIDASPKIVDGRVRLNLTVVRANYATTLGGNPPPSQTPQPFAMSNMPSNVTLDVLLDSGKSVTVLDATEPATNQKLTIEVTATILK
jgi:hypothetical protein